MPGRCWSKASPTRRRRSMWSAARLAGVDEAAEAEEVIRAADDRDRDRRPDEAVDPRRGVLDEDEHEHHRHLGDRLDLPPDRSGYDLAVLHRQLTQTRDGELAGDDDHRHPGAEPVQAD